jgi:[acyl-carrier-protein] S-malonyltransferase
MGKELAARYPEIADVYAEADAALGFYLSELCWNGPEDLLTRTDNAQPAILTTSLAHLKALQFEQPETFLAEKPGFVAGHSLGEYTALVVAGVLDFAEAVRLVHRRGELMNEAGKGTSGMSAVIGGDDSLIEEICHETGTEVANYNSPGQIAVSGTKENLVKFAEMAKERGIKKVISLPVSAAFHSNLMRPMAGELEKYIEQVQFFDAKIPVVSNVSAQPLVDAATIKKELVLQTYSPVRWVESTRTMYAGGASRFVEIGPGKVLTGLIKRIEKEAALLNSEDLLK